MSKNAWNAHKRADKNGNRDCLKGMQCPECGEYEQFDIEVITTAIVTDDYPQVDQENIHWTDRSDCCCSTCGSEGKVSDFKAAYQAAHGKSKATQPEQQ